MAQPARRAGSRPYKSREERRDEIVSATLAILTERGLHAWKTAELARRVGVSEPTLFRHFKNKDEILVAAAQRAIGLVRARIQADQEGAAPRERVRDLVLGVLDVVGETGGAPIIVLAGPLGAVSPAIRRRIQRALRALRDRLIALFEAGRADGTAAVASPEALADLAIAVVQSCALRWVISGRTFPMRVHAQAMLQAIDCAASSEARETAKRRRDA